MFLKPFRIKSNNAVKGSVRKQLKKDISEQYPLASEELIDSVIPTKALYCVRGESGKDGFVSTFYVVDNQPIFFRSTHNTILPTVYTLWNHPQLVRCVTTNSFVLNKLQDGADLMLPGVYGQDKGGFPLDGIAVGEPLAVNLVGNRAAVAVGISLLSSDQMVANQMRGKFLEVLHVYEDHLWSFGTKNQLPSIPYHLGADESVSATDEEAHDEALSLPQEHPEQSDMHARVDIGESVLLVGSTNTERELTIVDKELEKLKTFDETTADISTTFSENPSSHEASGGLQLTGVSADDGDMSDQSEPEIDMDELLLECFLKAVKSLVKPKDLPLLTSTLYGSLMTQVCPSDVRLEIKKSSYKKVSKFLGSLVSKGVIEVSSDGGTDSVSNINFEHELLLNFRPVLTRGYRQKSKETAVSQSCAPITVEEMWSPTRALYPVFSSYGVHKDSMISSSDVRTMITQYVRDNQLVNPDNPQMVTIDPVLSSALKITVETTSLFWKDLFPKVFAQMRPSFIIRQGTRETLVKHNLPKVKLTVCRRANKTVTLVDNLDLYGIPTTEVAHQIQKQAACHSAVQTAAGGSCGQQVLVQGNQVKALVKILESHGLPARLMEAQDNIKSGKSTKTKSKRK